MFDKLDMVLTPYKDFIFTLEIEQFGESRYYAMVLVARNYGQEIKLGVKKVILKENFELIFGDVLRTQRKSLEAKIDAL